MAIPTKKVSPAESLATISNVLLSAFIILTLYFGRDLLVPLALAALLTFMLAPLVSKLQRWIGRIAAVLVVVALLFGVAGFAGWVLTQQALDLANKLPDYKVNIQTKMRVLQQGQGSGSISKVSETLEELKKELPGGEPEGSPAASVGVMLHQEKPMRVELVKDQNGSLEWVQVILGPILGPLGTAALVLLLLIFMLLQREDLRNRLIRLIGQGRISSTSRALDDAGSRVSRYLLMQLVVNATYGIAAAIGLYFIGVPNAILWGALATVLRFIPYVGPWIGAAFPILLSLAASPTWMAPLLTMGLFVVLELISNNVMEPWLYGSSTGVTPIALIVAALIWTWLWGPVGLVLATPLTVCLLVMGRHVPKLAFLSIVFSDEEALTPAEDCYQRLLRAGEHDEMELVDSFLKDNSLTALFDSLLIPVVATAGSDHRLGLLATEQLEFLEQGVSDILDDLELRPDLERTEPTPAAEGMESPVCCIPARADRDRLAGGMLVQALRQQGYDARNALPQMSVADLISWVKDAGARVVCISALVPTTIIQARYLCSKLRNQLPEVKIIVGLWSNPTRATEAAAVLRESGADEIVSSVADALERVAAEKSLVIGHES